MTTRATILAVTGTVFFNINAVLKEHLANHGVPDKNEKIHLNKALLKKDINQTLQFYHIDPRELQTPDPSNFQTQIELDHCQEDTTEFAQLMDEQARNIAQGFLTLALSTFYDPTPKLFGIGGFQLTNAAQAKHPETMLKEQIGFSIAKWDEAVQKIEHTFALGHIFNDILIRESDYDLTENEWRFFYDTVLDLCEAVKETETDVWLQYYHPNKQNFYPDLQQLADLVQFLSEAPVLLTEVDTPIPLETL